MIWDQGVYAEAEVREGAFTLPTTTDAKDWYVAVYELGRPPTIVGPLALPLGKATPVAVAATEPGRLSGKVSERPVKWDGYLWVVAYSKNGYRSEARVGDDGTFHFPALPPGEYGLKVGHDLFTDEEIMAEEPQPPAWKIQPPADPWKRAKLATVESGKSTTVDSLTLPDR